MTTTKKATQAKETVKENEELKQMEEEVEIEPGLKVKVSIRPNDLRLSFTLREFKKYSKKLDKLGDMSEMSDEDAESFIDVLAQLLELVIGKDGFKEIQEFYGDKHGEFSPEDMSLVLEKAFGDQGKE